MAIPEQVRKQNEAIDELYAKAAQGAAGDDQRTGAEPEDDEQAGADETQDTDEAVPGDEQTSGKDERAQGEDFAQKYRTLQGMYNAEVPRLHQQNKDLNQRIQQMEQLLSTLASPQPNAQKPADQTKAQQKYVSEEDVSEYGESLEVMRRVSKEEVHPLAQRLDRIEQMLQQMQTQVVPQVQHIAQRQQFSAEQQFWADLAAAVPEYRKINANEGFQKWLLETDPMTGLVRQTYLEDAQQALDAQRVANIFRAWGSSTGQAVDAQTTGRVSSAGSELEKQVAPGRSRSSGAPAGNNGAKMYTPQDIQKFFQDVSMGKYVGQEQERARIERDIFAAQRENRIQLNA